MKVLIPTDGSPDAQAAVQTALRLLSTADRNIDLLCVAPTYSRGAGRKRYEQRILSETTEILEKARAQIGNDGTNVRVLPAIGSPAAVIVNRSEDYDLTVIGPKGRGAGANVALGPVASRVVEHALGPVLIARELRSESGLRILIAADGSDASVAAINTLTRLFDLRGSEATFMHVAETPWIHLGLEEDWETYDEDEKERSDAGVLEKQMTREGSAIVNQARDLLRGTGASVETAMDEGNPADAILGEAERGQYDLIVLGASGRRDLKHSMLGSVSSKLAWNAPCSVLVVREPAQ
ncbi:MAG: universal stress protein [Acidobacteriia bacterium]|nr:universal stress protein [Terriglobia bacterium]